MRFGLGRLVSEDPRDQQYLLAAPRLTPGRTSRSWFDNGWWGNQGNQPQCVGYAWAHFIEDSPETHPDPERSAYVDPAEIYHEAQKIDEFPGEGYDGTTVRAGAKYLQKSGYIGEYLWAYDADTLARNILEVGPVVMGTDWYQGMFSPDNKGILHLEGPNAGGHAYLINGYNSQRKLFRIKNSWGRMWGEQGRAYLRFKDLQTLLDDQGEACMATEHE